MIRRSDYNVDLDCNEISDDELDHEGEEDVFVNEVNFQYKDWTLVDVESDRRPATDFTFFALHGLHPKYDDVPNKDGLFFCNLMFPDELFELLASYTNTRASETSKWFPVSSNEMKKFLGCLLVMGIIRKPRLDMYWSLDEMLETPFFGNEKCLSRDRFLVILKFLRFADYSNLKANDPLRKISPFCDYVRKLIQSVYMPDQNVAIDEILLLFKGRIYFRAYIPSKRSRYGIKIYAVIDQHGYMWDFFINTTASNLELPAHLNINRESLGFSGNVVVRLMHGLFDMNYRVFCDNFFVSDKLAQYLIVNRTHLCGTVRFNRLPSAVKEDFPAEIKSLKHFRKDHMLISCFTEKKQSGKKNIAILDTMAEPREVEKSLIKKGGTVNKVTRPSSLESYNLYMGAVDQADAQLHPYDITRKSLNWARKTGIHLLHRLLLNAFNLYKQSNDDLTFLAFTMMYARHLFDSTGIGRKTGPKGGRPRLMKEIMENHVPKKIPPSEKKTNPSLRCRVCTSQGIRKETRLFCDSCTCKPPLCAHPCFNIYHSYK